MNSTVTSTLGFGTLRRLALRATFAASLLATTVVAFGGIAWAGPEMGC